MDDMSEKELVEHIESETKMLIIEAWSFLDDLILKSASREEVAARHEQEKKVLNHLKERILALEAKLANPDNDQG